MFGFLKRLLGGRPAPFGYSPRIGRSQRVREYRLGEYRAELLTDIQSTGSVEYAHLLAVYDAEGNPVYFVASEVNAMAQQIGGGSHFLGTFDGKGHQNRGHSDQWADRETFAAEAVKIVKERFGIVAEDTP